MQKLPYPPDNDLIKYYIANEFPRSYVAYVRFCSANQSLRYGLDIGVANNEMTELITRGYLILKFDTESELVHFVNYFPKSVGYAVAYADGVAITEN